VDKCVVPFLSGIYVTDLCSSPNTLLFARLPPHGRISPICALPPIHLPLPPPPHRISGPIRVCQLLEYLRMSRPYFINLCPSANVVFSRSMIQTWLLAIPWRKLSTGPHIIHCIISTSPSTMVRYASISLWCFSVSSRFIVNPERKPSTCSSSSLRCQRLTFST